MMELDRNMWNTLVRQRSDSQYMLQASVRVLSRQSETSFLTDMTGRITINDDEPSQFGDSEDT